MTALGQAVDCTVEADDVPGGRSALLKSTRKITKNNMKHVFNIKNSTHERSSTSISHLVTIVSNESDRSKTSTTKAISVEHLPDTGESLLFEDLQRSSTHAAKVLLWHSRTWPWCSAGHP